MRKGYTAATVVIDGKYLPPAGSLRVENHSPTGFEWGYGGSGPTQLALALMLEAGLSDGAARSLYMVFKREVIARLGWECEMGGAEILDWIDAQGCRRP